MNLYKTQKLEVRTITTIEITQENMYYILDEAKKTSPSLLHAHEAFQDYDLAEMELTRSTCSKLLKELWHPTRANADTIKYIVTNMFGFDGVENYGYYNAATGSVKMVVFNLGDHANW